MPMSHKEEAWSAVPRMQAEDGEGQLSCLMSKRPRLQDVPEEEESVAQRQNNTAYMQVSNTGELCKIWVCNKRLGR